MARAPSFVDRADRAIGSGVTRAVRFHHRRRLARAGWLRALDGTGDGWATGALPRRGGCSLEVLVDGATALPRIAAELEQATSHVYLAGWDFSPDFALTRGERPTVLRNLLAELATRVDVRVIAWAGSPLPLFRPSRSDARERRKRLCAGTGVRCILDARERPLHCHHQKTVVVDDRVAFVGGIDLTDLNGDRFDTSAHPARATVGWHDATALVHGPAVADVAATFRMRWRYLTGESLAAPPPPEAEGTTELQVVRTIPERTAAGVRHGEFGILEAYTGALRQARELVYLESQFLWSPEIVEILAGKLRHPPGDDFRLVVLLPARPNNGADDTRGMLGELLEADDGRGRLLACTLLARSGALSDPVYVHAKVGIVDDRWLTLGSANLNDHSLLNDTEMNVVTRDREIVRDTRLRLWAEHLESTPEDVAGPPAEVFDRWRSVAAEQLARWRRGRALTHRLVELPHLSRRSARLLGPLQGLLVDG